MNDIALSKRCAWREKDTSWLKAGLDTSALDVGVMKARSRSISNPNTPDATEIARRLARLAHSR